jgi:CSLREA domain-containing protein
MYSRNSISRMFPVLVVIVTLIFGLFTPTTIVHAATFTVNTSNDNTTAGDDSCTLREAIASANNAGNGDCGVNSGVADTITIGTNTITLDPALGQLPPVTTTIIINGNGVLNTIIEANAAFNTASYRVFEVTSTGNLTLNNLTVQNGRCNGFCATASNYGGGILNVGALTITNSKVSNNFATSGGGGIYNAGSLTIVNSIFSGASLVASSDAGGAIFNSGSTTSITNSTFSANFTTNAGGAIYNSSASPMTITNSTFSGNTSNGNSGGAIYNSTTLTITNSTFSGNSAGIGGGGISNAGTLNITNSTFSGNTASAGGVMGGGIRQFDGGGGSVTLRNTIVANNTTGGNCSGTITNGGNNIDDGTTCNWGSASGSKSSTNPLLGALSDNGGPTQTFGLLLGSPAVDAGNDTICTAPPVSNLDQRGFSRLRGAHCDIGAYERAFRYVATTTGSNTSPVNNNCTDSLFPCQTIYYATTQAKQGDVISIAAGTYTENSIPFGGFEIVGAGMNQTILDGGGISLVASVASGKTASVADLTIQHGNYSGDGGGIVSDGPLTLKRVKITSNHTSGSGGGGIYSFSALTMTDSIVSANTSTGIGGGIVISTNAAVNLTNVTISENTATGSSGGIHIQGNPTVNLTNVTISGNTASDAGGLLVSTGTITILNSTITNNHKTSGTAGGIVFYNNTLNIKNTIVAGNDGDECNGSINSQGYNLSSDATCSFTKPGDHPSTNPLLGPLANNGGPTQTHALLTGSPAIDAGTNTGCPSTDQRGVTRPIDGDAVVGAICDIGAYEFGYQLFLPLILR